LFVDEHIKHMVWKMPSYIRDTTDFIKKVQDIKGVTENSILVTMDVSSLYINIPHEEGD